MVGQDQKTLDERGCEHDRDRKGYISDQVSKPASHHNQPKKRDNRGGGCGKDRQGHAASCSFCRGHGAQAFTGLLIRMFANHDRIIHNDAKRDDQRKQRNHINRDPRSIHHRQSGQHRGRNAGRHPKGGARIQKQKQQDQYQTKTA